MSNNIIFFYDHFYPDFSAGGPVTSLYNLAKLVKDTINIRILTSAYAYQSGQKMTAIEVDCWTNYKGLPVWYASDRLSMRKAIEYCANDRFVTFYLNGLFSPSFFLYPLWLAKKSKFNIIVSPRGMLQAGALGRGTLKKKTYLALIKWSRLLQSAKWHATDEQEALDIKFMIGSNSIVDVVANVPLISEPVRSIAKEMGELHLVYFSLIAEKKNLHFLLDVINSQDFTNLQLSIIGPIKDKLYWSRCLKLMHAIIHPQRVKYLGEIAPEKIKDTLANYHALVLPTLGENFGHAIVEMLACSRPVIISDKTPWNDIENQGAGYALELNKKKWTEALNAMVGWNQKEFDARSNSASNYYQSKFNFDDLKMRYLKLFANPL